MIDCGMCGHAFTQEEGAACQSGCPMATGCGMVTCPSCGYEFPAESKVVRFITNLVRRASARGPRPAPRGADPGAAPGGVRGSSLARAPAPTSETAPRPLATFGGGGHG